jgi:hypothetical protein
MVDWLQQHEFCWGVSFQTAAPVQSGEMEALELDELKLNFEHALPRWIHRVRHGDLRSQSPARLGEPPHKIPAAVRLTEGAERNSFRGFDLTHVRNRRISEA